MFTSYVTLPSFEFPVTILLGHYRQSYIAGRTGHIATVGKLFFNVSCFFMVSTLYLMRKPDMEVALIVLSAL